MESVKIPASKMAAIKQSPVPPPPPLSFCEGPRILQNLRDVVFQILELPLYILSFLPSAWDFLNDPKLLVAQCTLIYQMGVHKENQIKARYIHIIQCNISDQWHVIYFSGIKSTPFIKIYGTLLLIPSLHYWFKINT